MDKNKQLQGSEVPFDIRIINQRTESHDGPQRRIERWNWAVSYLLRHGLTKSSGEPGGFPPTRASESDSESSVLWKQLSLGWPPILSN